MNRRQRQKARERGYVAECAKLIGLDWRIVEEREAPDFVVTDGPTTFGLEVVEVFKDAGATNSGSAEKHAEALRARVIDEMRSTYETVPEATSLKVQIVGPWCNEHVASIASELARRKIPDEGWLRFDVGERMRVHARRAFRAQWEYVHDTGGWVLQGRHALPPILATLARKARNLRAYQNAVGKDVRLLLVANRRTNSGKLSPDFADEVDLRGFAEVYFLSSPHTAIGLSMVRSR